MIFSDNNLGKVLGPLSELLRSEQGTGYTVKYTWQPIVCANQPADSAGHQSGALIQPTRGKKQNRPVSRSGNGNGNRNRNLSF